PGAVRGVLGPVGLAPFRPGLGREGLEGQRVDRPVHELAEGAVDELVLRDAAQALEIGGDDGRVVVVLRAREIADLEVDDAFEVLTNPGFDDAGFNHGGDIIDLPRALSTWVRPCGARRGATT